MSNLVEHARRELERVETDPWLIGGLLRVVQAFADMGHSGGSASASIPMLNDLLQFKNLSPLSDDPAEWIDHTETYPTSPGLWQNIRNSEAFSLDRGKTYYLLSENNERGLDNLIFHEAELSGKTPGSAPPVLPSLLGNIVDSPGHD